MACKTMDRINMETELKWRDLAFEVPYIQLPADYEIAVTPPFSGASARMRVRKAGAEHGVSVYLDTDCSLGYYTDERGQPKPYWEVYPVDGDTGRCDMADAAELVRMIVQGIEEQGATP